MLQHFHQVSSKFVFIIIYSLKFICFKLSYHNECKSYLRPDEDVVTSKISPVNLFTLLH